MANLIFGKPLLYYLEQAQKAGACPKTIEFLWDLGEPGKILMHPQTPTFCLWYAVFVLNDRWPDAEPVILKSERATIHYCNLIIKGRWYEAEHYIMKNPYFAFLYAEKVIKDRWPEAEEFIKKDKLWWRLYKEKFAVPDPELDIKPRINDNTNKSGERNG